jgi:hypothetical protein
MTRSNIDLAQCRYEATSHHAGRLAARHRGEKEAERTVAGRSTSIPAFGVLALLATAALPSNAGTIEPRGPLGEAERATVGVIVAPGDPSKFVARQFRTELCEVSPALWKAE